MEVNKIINQDCLTGLKSLEDNCIDCCITSPPYFGLRDYGYNEQIGLEETPELYVSKMVEVFTEVKRVLKPTGTLWLNLGDSYAGSGKGGQSEEKRSANWQPTYGNKGKRFGLKPKDLMLIPSDVAKALRGPFYTGKIKNELDRIWLAAMIDGEGCMFIHKRKAGQKAYSDFTKKDGTVSQYSRTQDTYGTGLEVANTHKLIVERCLSITGIGSICTVERETSLKKRNIPLHRWNVRSNECKEIIKEIYPYLVGKQHEARILLNCPSSGTLAEKSHIALMLLHNGKETDIDFPPPPSLFEPGFYLRQDIIWAKDNPMPESVTDRCTKAHEYIFLMSKSSKYYYDADAISETATGFDGRKDTLMKGSPKYANGFVPNQSPQTVAAKGHERWKRRKNDGTNYGGNGTGFQDHSGYSNLENPYVRNKRSVWTVNTMPYSEAHFATFPERLITDMIKAGCPEYVCNKCGKAREKIIKSEPIHDRTQPQQYASYRKVNGQPDQTKSGVKTTITGLTDCGCNAGFSPGVVLDCFMGAGTTAVVAKKLNRNYLGFELNAEYITIAEKRLYKEIGMFL